MNAPESSMRTRILIVVLVALGILVAGAAGWVFFGRAWFAEQEEVRVLETLRTDPRTADAAATIAQYMPEIAAHPDDAEKYLIVANAWKAAADLGADASHYRRAAAWYERGIAATDGKNAVLMQNLAVVLRLDHRPEEAERALRRAIEVSPGDPTLYLALVDVLKTDLKRDSAAVIDVYRSGLDTVVSNAPIVQSLAQYLEEQGRYAEALTYYELLAAKYPGFEDKIAELKRTIASQP